MLQKIFYLNFLNVIVSAISQSKIIVCFKYFSFFIKTELKQETLYFITIHSFYNLSFVLFNYLTYC